MAREFPLNVRLNKGLRPDFRNKRNSDFLTEAFNCKVNEQGTVPYQPIQIPFTASQLDGAGIEFDWPFPQLFQGKSRIFLLTRSRIYFVNQEDFVILPPDQLYNALTPANTTTIVKGNRWQFVDFWDTWMFHNGNCTVFHTGKHSMLGTTDKIYVARKPRVQAGCAFRGRAWFGGFDPDYFYTAAWKSFYEDWASRKTTGLNISLDGLGENCVFWTTIGGGDMAFLFHANQEALDSQIASARYGTTKPFIFDHIRMNTMGSMPMPWMGKVLKMKPLGKVIMVYGENGVSALTPQGEAVGLLKFPDLTQGIRHEGCVGGNEKEHLVLDNYGHLWHIGGDLSPRELGYREFMQPMLGSDVVISHSPLQGGEFYICNGVKAYILTKSGLTEHGQQVSGIMSHRGENWGIGVHPDQMSDKEFRLKTEVLDMAQPDYKTLGWVELLGENAFPTAEGPASEWYVSTEYKYRKDRNFATSTEKLVNWEGTAYLNVTSKEFRVKVRATDYRDVNLDVLNLRWQHQGRRYTRGPSFQPQEV